MTGKLAATSLRWHGWRVLVALAMAAGSASQAKEPDDWTQQQLAKLPAGETPVRLFNGQDFTGWKGQTEKYFSIEAGEIVGRNAADNAPQFSTYLVTDKPYRNFRLIFEAKLVESEMHSGIALWGQTVEKGGDPYSYQGHLVMFPSGYGYYDLYRRNSIYKDDGRARRAGHQHDWNRMEILAIGNRIRHVVNGQLVADWSDPQPELCQPGPLGLQLHSNKVPQEVRFRGLVLVEDPTDALVTVDTSATSAAEEINDPFARIGQRMQQFIAAGQISGAVTMVIQNGKVVHLAPTGLADVETNRPMRRNTPFAIASMTKPITATAVMMLVDEGKLALDDPAAKYIPQFRDVRLESGAAPQREITVRDLLTHTSGLVGSQANEGTLAETAVAMARRPLGFEPGSQWQYGPGLTICGRIVEVVSGQPYEQFLAQRIFEPLGMIDTTFFPTDEQQARLARLYQPGTNGQQLAPAEHWIVDFSSGRTANPSGGLISTAADLARFYQMILRGGTVGDKRIVSAEAIREMTRIQTGDLPTGFTSGNGWGLGWCVIREPQGVSAVLSPGSFGHGGAFGTQAWLDPQRRAAYVLLVQRTNFGNSDGSDIRGEFQRLAAEALGSRAKN